MPVGFQGKSIHASSNVSDNLDDSTLLEEAPSEETNIDPALLDLEGNTLLSDDDENDVDIPEDMDEINDNEDSTDEGGCLFSRL